MAAINSRILALGSDSKVKSHVTAKNLVHGTVSPAILDTELNNRATKGMQTRASQSASQF